MRYLGGKSRHAKALAGVMLSRTSGRSAYVEPFLGGANVLKVMAPHFDVCFASDIDPDVIAYWTAIQSGWTPPSDITEEDYRTLKDAQPSALRAHAAFNASFGGKKWGGYARCTKANGEPRNLADESSRADTKPAVRGALGNVVFRCATYEQSVPPVESGLTIYCDPPYAGTTGYAAKGWDAERFWRWAVDRAGLGDLVFVSEYSIPEQVEHDVIWSAEHVKSVGGGTRTRKRSTENLYLVHGGATSAVWTGGVSR